MRIFGGERMQNLMLRLGMEEDVPIESKLITQAHRGRPESRRSAALRLPQTPPRIRRRDEQAAPGRLRHAPRSCSKARIRKSASSKSSQGIVGTFVDHVAVRKASRHDQYDLTGLQSDVLSSVRSEDRSGGTGRTSRARRSKITSTICLTARYQGKRRLIGPENMREAERIVMLNVIDNQWKDHLLSMDHLKEGIGLRGYGQKDPLIEYKKESFTMFQDMMDRIEDETIKFLYFMRIETGMGSPPLPYPEPEEDEDIFEGAATADGDDSPASS